MRRVPGAVSLVIGLVLVIGLFAMSGFGNAEAGERLIDDAEGSVGDTGIVRFRNDLEILKAAAVEITTVLFPDYAAVYELNDAEFEARLREQYPPLATTVLDRGEEIIGALERGVSNLEAHQDDYEAADDIPVSWLPITVMPWFALALGLVLIGLGLWSLRTTSPLVPLAIGLLGLVLVALTLAIRLPGKTDQAEELIDSLNITEEVAATTRDQFEAAVAGGDELVPFVADLATAEGIGEAELLASLRTRFPALNVVLEDPAVFDRIEGEVIYRETHVDDFAKVKDEPINATSWGFVAMGALLAVAGLSTWGLATRRPQGTPPA